jgi:sortase A
MKRKSKTRRWIGNIFLLAGVVGLAFWIWSVASRVAYQDWESWAFDREARGKQTTISEYLAEKGARLEESLRARLKMPAKSTPPVPAPAPMPAAHPSPPIGKDGVVGRLRIPRLHLSAIVREGAGEGTLRVAAGHIPGTALPGQNGNVGVAAHRDTIFRGLGDIHKNDVIEFETLGARYTYQVESTDIVTPRDTDVLKPRKQPELTLVTCYPFYYVGSAPDRFIVRARELSPSPVGQQPAAATGQSGPLPGPAPGAPEDPKPARPSAQSRSDWLARADANLERRTRDRRIFFAVSSYHCRQLVPGISFGLNRTDEAGRRLDGWMWLMPEHRTIWMLGHHMLDPVVFYGGVDGRRRELVITRVTRDAVAGYLLLADDWSAGPGAVGMR